MRYVAAYLLAAMGNTKEDPKAADVERILSSVGIEAEADKVKKVVGELAGKSIEELMEQGATRLASMPAGGAPAASGAAPAGDAAAPAAEEKKKEEKKEESEESDDDMGFGLFD